MTRFEEKLYLQSVFDAIDQVYKLKKPTQISTYEERLRASFNKLLVPDWYNHDYTSMNGLRKTKSHGHVPRTKKIINNHNNNNNNHNDDISDASTSSSVNSPYLSNGTNRQSFRHRSPSRSWSERPPLRRDSTASSYDTNGSIINGRRSITSNGSSTYAPGVQRVAQSSTWYKPRTFTPKITNGKTNGHSIEPPKPLPRYSKIDQERTHSLDTSSLPPKIENVRSPIKPRTMAQAQIPPDETLLDISSDADVTLVQQSHTSEIPTDFPRTNSLRSISSEAESYRSANLPPTDKDLLATDSSSYASVNERCLSPSSTASYHTAVAGDTSSSSSIAGYETPTPQLDDDNATLSSNSSLSDLSHAETLEPNAEDLDIVAVSTAEHKSVIIPSVNSKMENNSTRLSSINTDLSSNENSNWYEGSLETSIQPIQIESSEIREISNDENLHEVDINAVGDEFFLCSPRTTTDDESSNMINNDNELDSPTQTSKLIFTMDDKTSNHFNNFHVSSSNDPFGFDHNITPSIIVTNLDDLSINDDDERYHRRPIQEDILYEVDHENSFSDHSQNTSSIIATDNNTSPSIKIDANIDYLTSTDSPNINPIRENEKQTSSPSSSSATTTTTTTKITDNNNILPIYILPPLFTTSKSEEPSTSLLIDTDDDNFQKWDSFVNQFTDLTSPHAYTSQIRHRHYSVGSYYDHKTTTVTLHPHHTHYILGSAPVSPLSRASTTSSESHYHLHNRHHSPMTYDNISLNALRRVNPFLESNNQDYRQTTNYRSSSLNREEKTRIITYTSPKTIPIPVERIIPVTPIIPEPITSPPSTRTSSVAFPQYEIPNNHVKQTNEISTSPPPLPPPRPIFFEQESTIIRPKTSRGRVPTPPSSPQIKSQNIYQEIDSALTTNNNKLPRRNSDLQFIRDAIERVFDFNGDSTSESSVHYEELPDDNKFKKDSNQYPAVQAVQRFYNLEKKLPSEQQITNLDDHLLSTSSTSKKSVITARKKNQSSSEEIDDTLNDIEDVDDHDEKSKRQLTSNENSPNQLKINKTSQETQTIGRQKPSVILTRSTVPPIDIVTEMVIEQDGDDDDDVDNGEINEADGDMVIFYDDIEIVEHSASTSSCSSESESSSSSTTSSSDHYSKPQPLPPPPIPARTLKPNHLVNNSQHQLPSTTNQTYDFDKTGIRKRFDVNSVNDMLNRTDYNIEPATSHRHPSARHFVGKLNSEELPLSNGHKTPLPTSNGNHRSIIADTSALVKQIQNSLSRNSLHDTKTNTKSLSTSSKNLREFVSSTYSPTDENVIDDNGVVHIRPKVNNHDEQLFKKQARLSKSFHNVSEYKSTDQYPKTENNLASTTQPSKSVENNLNQFKPLNLTSLVTSTSFSAIPNSDDNARMLSMKWYTGHVSENSEICYDAHHANGNDLLHGYITAHSNREIQAIFSRLQASNDPRIHAALDDIRSRVAIFDASKTQDDLHVFMRYLESRLRDLNNKNLNGHTNADTISTNSRQLGRQHYRSIETNGNHQARRSSQSSANQENPAIFDEMLNTVLGLPKKGVSTHPNKREKPPPLVQTQVITNITTNHKPRRDTGKRLFESGTYKDPRLIYDGPKRKEKEEEPLETSV